MPDFNPARGSAQGPIRRPAGRPPVHYGHGGLPTEGADPAPTPWPIAPWVALIFCGGFLALQLWPATHYRHPGDPSRTWHPYARDGDAQTLESTRHEWDPFVDSDRFPRDVPVEQVNQSPAELEDVERTQSHELLRKRKEQYVNIFLCTDEKDLRPVAVVINSTLSHARRPERIKFYLVIPASESKLEYYKLKTFLPHASIKIVSEGINLGEISKLIKYREDGKARKELTTPYNFVPYYLPGLLKDKEIDKFIYLDSDVVVKGDIEELYVKGLEGYAIAAVRDCSQRFKSYFDFQQLKEIQKRDKDLKPWLPNEPFDEEECIFNRGALMIDVNQWIQMNITEAIEWWMEEYYNSKKVLYKYGLSQPPFLLALYHKYKEVDPAWNIRGLGRDQFSSLEQDFMAETYGQRPEKKPFVSMESDYAKILHFNGKFKPWKRDRVRHKSEHVVSLCGQDGHECYKLWWEYLSPIADEGLKHTSKDEQIP